MLAHQVWHQGVQRVYGRVFREYSHERGRQDSRRVLNVRAWCHKVVGFIQVNNKIKVIQVWPSLIDPSGYPRFARPKVFFSRFSMIVPDFQRFSIYFQPFVNDCSMVVNDFSMIFQWFSNDFQWLSLMFQWIFIVFCIDVQWCSMICQRFSLIFIDLSLIFQEISMIVNDCPTIFNDF